MGFFSRMFNKEKAQEHGDKEIVAVADGIMGPASSISDATFREELLGQTIGFSLQTGTIVSPANGKLEMIFPTGHAFSLRMNDGTGLLVHIGINTVGMKGEGFRVLARQGDTVKAGQPVVKVDLEAVKRAGYENTTMLIVAEPVHQEKISYLPFGEVRRGQTIAKNQQDSQKEG